MSFCKQYKSITNTAKLEGLCIPTNGTVWPPLGSEGGLSMITMILVQC